MACDWWMFFKGFFVPVVGFAVLFQIAIQYIGGKIKKYEHK